MPKKIEKKNQFTIPLEFKPQEGFGGGFRSEWVSAEGNGIKAGFDSGAGLWNPFLTFWIEKKGKKSYYNANVGDLLRAAIDEVEAA